MATINTTISAAEKRKLEKLMRYYRSMSDRIIVLYSEGMSAQAISQKLTIPISFINTEIYKFSRNGRQSIAQIQGVL